MVYFEVVGNVIFWEVFLISGRGEAIGFIFCRIGPVRKIVFHVIDEVAQFWGWNLKLEIRGYDLGYDSRRNWGDVTRGHSPGNARVPDSG